MAVDYVSLGKRIQARRKEAHLTQERMAEALSVTVGYISQIERGITRVNLDTLSELAEELGCDITDFLGGTAAGTATYLHADLDAVFGKLTAANRKALLEISEVLLRAQ